MEPMQNGGKSGGNNAVVAVLVLAVIALAAFFAYKQGYLTGKDANPSDQPDIQINLPGGSSTPAPTSGGAY
jgi:septal ring-binding cell division protein DamX